METASTTSRWQHFGTGQPFNWVVGPAGVFCQFVDKPTVNTAVILHAANSDALTVRNSILLGRLPAPASTPFLWHLAAAGRPETENGWLGMYQYLRRRYCERTGIALAQPLPTSQHTNTCTSTEVDTCIAAAVRLGFVRHMLPLCPSPFEALTAAKVEDLYRRIEAAGLRPKPWSPGAYTQGMDNEIAQDHPDWLVYDRNGDVLQYFDSHPVFDFNNPEYRAHCFAIIDEAVNLGMKDIYLDMGGAQAAVVNYRAPRPVPGLVGAMEVYRYLRDRGVSAGIEGQNPLVLDNFWYRQNLYVSHSGNEFAFVGMTLLTNAPDHLSLDYFRLGMHGAFFTATIAGYACGMERIPGENDLTEEMGILNGMFNKAIALVGMPFVQQTPFGTSWTSDTGAALCVWHPVEKLDLRLPAGWRTLEVLTPSGPRHVEGDKSLAELPHKSIVLIGRD